MTGSNSQHLIRKQTSKVCPKILRFIWFHGPEWEKNITGLLLHFSNIYGIKIYSKTKLISYISGQELLSFIIIMHISKPFSKPDLKVKSVTGYGIRNKLCVMILVLIVAISFYWDHFLKLDHTANEVLLPIAEKWTSHRKPFWYQITAWLFVCCFFKVLVS